MKTTWRGVGGLILAVAMVAGAAPAQPENRPGGDRPAQPGDRPGQPGQRGPGGPRDGGGPSIEGAMKSINRAFRTVRQEIGKPDSKPQVLAAINQMQAGAVAAKGQALKAEGNAEQQAARTLEFRRAMIDLTRTLLQLESDVLDGKPSEAAAGVAKIQAMREQMHEKFGVKDDE